MKKGSKKFTVKGKGKLSICDNIIVDNSYFFNKTSERLGELVFQEGTSRAIRLELSKQGYTKLGMIEFAEKYKGTFDNSPLFEALRTRKGYTEKGKEYTYEDAVKNLRPLVVRKAIDENFAENRPLINDVKKVKK
jgi:hypothetical protein